MTTCNPRRAPLLGLLALLLLVPPALAQPAPSAAERLALTVGRSTVLATDFDVTRIAVTNPEIANATVVEPRAVLIDGKAPGTITIFLWGDTRRVQYEVAVDPGVPPLQLQLRTLFPGEPVLVTTNDEAIVLSGQVSNPGAAKRMVDIATATSAKSKVINLLQLPAGVQNEQVLLQVRFAEVNRRALTELGVSLFTGPNGVRNTVGRTSTQQFAAPDFTEMNYGKTGQHWWDFGKMVNEAEGKFTFSDFLNIFLFSEKYDLGAVIRALNQKGLFQSLAEPNLIAYNGKEASFLAGGEIPIPLVQGVSGGSGSAVTISYKEFGVRLNFTPTIVGDTVRLHVRPEVSSLDYSNALSLGGFRVPALSTRRAETEVELRDGQSFAIAGLLDNTLQDSVDKIPGLGDIPILGKLFQSKATAADRTELMVVITPRLVRPLNAAEVPPLPTMAKPFLAPLEGGTAPNPGVVDAPPVTAPQGGVR